MYRLHVIVQWDLILGGKKKSVSPGLTAYAELGCNCAKYYSTYDMRLFLEE